jgi:hypothetical protein
VKQLQPVMVTINTLETLPTVIDVEHVQKDWCQAMTEELVLSLNMVAIVPNHGTTTYRDVFNAQMD